MAFEFRFPDVGEGIHEGRVVEWLVAEGDPIVEDAPLVKVETDKAVVDIPSPRSGVVRRLHAAQGDTIHVGDVIVTFGEAGQDVPSPAAPPARAAAPAPAQSPVAPTAPAPAPAAPVGDPLGRPLATPHTRALARRLGVDLTTVAGSGPGGRITDDDVESATKRAVSAPTTSPALAPVATAPSPSPDPAKPPAPTAVGTPEERVPLTHLRKVIARAMHDSVQTAATVTHVDEVDVTDLLEAQRRLRGKLEAAGGPRLTLMPFFVRALVAALKRHPIFNATVDEAAGEIVFKKAYHVGLAVDTPEGLIVPVVKDADKKSLETLAREIRDLAEKARTRTLSLDELRGGTCTLTNIGPVGGLFATPIIRQPELAIVGTHAIRERPGYVGDEIRRRSYLYLSVSFDHRYIDGAQAARFLGDVRALLEDPDLLLARM